MSRFKPELNFATVISLIALFVALGGGAYAAVKLKTNQVKSKHIAPDAATGADVNEGTLGAVPTATNATNATNAGTASSLSGGFTPADFQFGDGIDDAFAGVFEAGETGGIALFEGAVGVLCQATPQIAYRDFGDGTEPDTDLWRDGVHESVDDDTDATAKDFAGETAQVQLWGGTGVVAHVVAGVHFIDNMPDPDECIVAFNSQENLDDNGVIFLGAEEGDARRKLESRRRLPEGWVEPSPRE
jgi:hypothetical protein